MFVPLVEMLRSSGETETVMRSLRATRALASRGDLSRRHIGTPLFVDALWALVVAQTRQVSSRGSDASASSHTGGDTLAVTQETRGKEDGSSPVPPETGGGGDGAPHDSGLKTEKNVVVADPRVRFHALRVLITVLANCWRASDVLIGGGEAHVTHANGQITPVVFHRDLAKLVELARPGKKRKETQKQKQDENEHGVGDATRVKAIRLITLLSRTGHGRTALCCVAGGNLPEALLEVIEEGFGGTGEDGGDGAKEGTDTGADGEDENGKNSNKNARDRRGARSAPAKRLVSTCLNLLGQLVAHRVGDTSEMALASPVDKVRVRSLKIMAKAFLRAPGFVARETRIAAGEALAKLVTVCPVSARECLENGLLDDIKHVLPKADRVELQNDTTDDTWDDVFAAAFGVGDTKSSKTGDATETNRAGTTIDTKNCEETDTKTQLTVPSTSPEFVTTALRLFTAMCTHAFVREDALHGESESGAGATEHATWTWTLLHQTMPAANDETRIDDDDDDESRVDTEKTVVVPDVPVEVEGVTDGGDADETAEASVADEKKQKTDAKKLSVPERFERFPNGGSLADGGRQADAGVTGNDELAVETTTTLDNTETTVTQSERTSPAASPTSTAFAQSDWRSLRARGVVSARVPNGIWDEKKNNPSPSSEPRYVFTPGEPPWNDPSTSLAALSALTVLAQHQTCLDELTRDGGAGVLCVAYLTKQCARQTSQFGNCVETATGLLGVLVPQTLSANDDESGRVCDATRDALSAVLVATREQHVSLLQRNVLATALVSLQLQEFVPPKRPWPVETTGAPTPKPKLLQTRFTNANLRAALSAVHGVYPGLSQGERKGGTTRGTDHEKGDTLEIISVP